MRPIGCWICMGFAPFWEILTDFDPSPYPTGFQKSTSVQSDFDPETRYVPRRFPRIRRSRSAPAMDGWILTCSVTKKTLHCSPFIPPSKAVHCKTMLFLSISLMASPKARRTCFISLSRNPVGPSTKSVLGQKAGCPPTTTNGLWLPGDEYSVYT